MPETREFLLKIIDVLLDFVRTTNDRNEKVLEFHHPEDMKKLLDLDLPHRGVTLQQLVEDCATTLKYQVKTGEYILLLIILNEFAIKAEIWTVSELGATKNSSFE